MTNLMRSRRLRLIVFFLLAIFLAFTYIKVSKYAVDGWFNRTKPYANAALDDQKIKYDFLVNEHLSTKDRYDKLFDYFLKGYLNYKSEKGALVNYPGVKGSKGVNIESLEGFARFFPLAASYISSDPSQINLRSMDIDLPQILGAAILEGTNKQSEEYWGDMNDKDQRIAEAADIALGLWLSKAHIWDKFDEKEKNQVANWLGQVRGRTVIDNNWLLFPVLVVKVLEALDMAEPKDASKAEDQYVKYKELNYLGEGWFIDEPSGIDYYNAWAVHYSLFWLDQIDPSLDREFIRNSNREFLGFYKYLFSKNGFPMMGRSVCYRIATPAPLIAGVFLSPEEISPGLALNALDSTWKYFIDNNSLDAGSVTQGFFETDPGILDQYSGTGSCLWSLRSLIMAFYTEGKMPFFDQKPLPLAVESSDFVVTNDLIGWKLVGKQSTQEIRLELLNNPKDTIIPIKQYGAVNRIKEYIFRCPIRPKNHDALYNNRFYSNHNSIFEYSSN